MGNSTTKKTKTAVRPKKPYTDFPLSPHASGAWQKKIRGKIHYFGRWGRTRKGKLERLPGDGWKEALELYKDQADDLHAGRVPRIAKDGELTLVKLCNQFLTAKMRQLESGEITARTFHEYRGTTDKLIAQFGKERLVDDLAADDFEAMRAVLAKQFGPVRLGNYIQRVRTVFKYGYESGIIDKPIRYGPQFKRPSATVLRKHRAASGKRLFAASEILALLDGTTVEDEKGKTKELPGASIQIRAMILLGINCGLGNSDISDIPQSAIDLDAGWITFPRPKTGIDRRCPLWPETVEALRASIVKRPAPKDELDNNCVFVTIHGRRWVRFGGPSNSTIDSVGQGFSKLLRSLSIDGRKRLGFYSLRHTFRTIADSTKDFPAIRLMMGHADGSIDGIYREHIENDRLQVVANYVRAWLFAKKEGE